MRLLTTISFLLITGIVLAQNTTALSTDIDERLLVKYELEYLQQLQENHPVLLQRLNYYLDHAWYIADEPQEKGLTDLPIVTIETTSELNILQLEKEQNVQRDPQRPIAYKIAKTNQILVYHSAKRFNQNFNQLRSK
ncbi:MAG: 2OG-Fe(II) oxygenase family protein [Saprospiraceae bacterium]